MSTSPNAPAAEEQYAYEAHGTPRWIYAVLIVFAAAIGWLLYAGHQSRTDLSVEIAKTNQRADLLAKQLDDSNARVAELQGRLDVTSEKLGLTQDELARARQMAAAIRKEQKESETQLAAKIGQVKLESEAKIGEVAAGVSGAKSDIEATRKDLEATKSSLQRAMGDMGVMSGLIARNHEDLEELKRRGERNYYEFELRKSKTPSRVGPIMVRLKDVNTKRSRYTLDVIAEDKPIEKKDKTVGEPVQFLVGRQRPPYELVVFELSKDRAVGYLSTPKEAPAAKN